MRVGAGRPRARQAALAWVRGTLARKPNPDGYERQLVAVLAGGGLEHHELPLAARSWSPTSAAGAPSPARSARPAGASTSSRRSLERVRPGPETRFGLSFAHSFRDQQGRRLVWFAVGRQPAPGERYRLRATVKRHGSQRGETVTVLTRCRCEWLARERETPAG